MFKQNVWLCVPYHLVNTLDDPVTLNMGLVLQALIRWFIFTIQCPFSFLYLQYCVLNVWVICWFMFLSTYLHIHYWLDSYLSSYLCNYSWSFIHSFINSPIYIFYHLWMFVCSILSSRREPLFLYLTPQWLMENTNLCSLSQSLLMSQK